MRAGMKAFACEDEYEGGGMKAGARARLSLRPTALFCLDLLVFLVPFLKILALPNWALPKPFAPIA